MAKSSQDRTLKGGEDQAGGGVTNASHRRHSRGEHPSKRWYWSWHQVERYAKA